MRTVRRSGLYYRVAAPHWVDPSDTSYSKRYGGRWNPAGEFGALYLNATVRVAAANVRARHAGRAIKLFDLLPEARPELITFDVPEVEVLDAMTTDGVAALGFADTFPFGIPWSSCQPIAREAYGGGVSGVAARSYAEASATSFAGEELALFDTVPLSNLHRRQSFHEWYPDPIPG